MNKTKYTSGEWSINNWPQANSDITIGTIGTPLIARIPLRDVSINEQKANAILIAAAPDLYKAAKKLLINALNNNELYDSNGVMHANWKALENAINKAQGEQE